MNLADLQRHWDAFGRQDPFWAILTDPSKRGNRWSPDEFFATGRTEVADLLDHAARLGVPQRHQSAFDFGCGAGRLTQALAAGFETVVGVDVAPSMVALARTYNRAGDRCTYEVNDRPDLSRWSDASFDLIYTSRVLQHIEPRYVRQYIEEFVRLLAPGGYLSFDLPSESGDAAAAADGVVPASAMRARLALSPPGPMALDGGSARGLDVEVTNLSHLAWHDAPGHALNVGNHWVAADGSLLQQDDGRVTLPTPLEPGQTARVHLTVRPPRVSGTYRLQVDVVQEGVAWFATAGSLPAELEVRVGTPAPQGSEAGHVPTADAPREDASPEDAPTMEMHAVPRTDVEALIRAAGARLLDVRRVHHCGPQWLAFRYDVTR